MEYSFWQDFFDTYQSLSDLVKILWLIVPPSFVLGITALIIFYKTRMKIHHSLNKSDASPYE